MSSQQNSNIDLAISNVRFRRHARNYFGRDFPKVKNESISTIEISGHVEYLPKELTELMPNLTHIKLLKCVKVEDFNLHFFDDGFEKIEKLTFQNNDAPAFISYSAFTKLCNLKCLDISSTRVYEIEEGAFKGNKNLRSITFFETAIERLPFNLFEDLERLEHVYFIYSPIVEIPEYLFYFNQQMREVLFLGITIKTIPDNLFSELPNLEDVTISETDITTLPKNMFANNPKLKRIDLSWTPLKNISLATFIELENLEYVNLLGNCYDTFYNGSDLMTSLLFDVENRCKWHWG